MGMFDGVHRGHRHLLRQVAAAAQAEGLTPAVVTFMSHPSQRLTPDSPVKNLTDTPTRLALLQENGAADIVLLDFCESLRCMSAREFLEMLHNDYAIDFLIVGFNNRFGHNRAEGFADYERYGREIGIKVLEATEARGGKVSSSIIRRLIAAGRVEDAAVELGRPYSIEGTVVGGKRIGRTIGFPTANIAPASARSLIPAGGVYAAYVTDVDTSERHKAMVNIGTRPTVNDDGSDLTIEAYLLDFNKDIYGHRLKVDFILRLRDEMRFGSLEELSARLQADEAATRRAL